MEWIGQLAITVLGSILTYLAATKKAKVELEKSKIEADNEIEKIREASNKEIERMRVGTEEQIKLKLAERDLASKEKNEEIQNRATSMFFDEFIKNPEKSIDKLKSMQGIANRFSKNKRV